MCAASRADLGRRYLKRGRRSTGVPTYLPAKRGGTSAIRRLDLDQGWIGDRREARGAIARGLAFLLAAERLDDLLGRHWRLVDPDAERIEDGSVDRGDHREQRALARRLSAVWSLGVGRLDEERVEFGPGE